MKKKRERVLFRGWVHRSEIIHLSPGLDVGVCIGVYTRSRPLFPEQYIRVKVVEE